MPVLSAQAGVAVWTAGGSGWWTRLRSLKPVAIANTPRTSIVIAKNTASVTRPISGQERMTMPTIASIRPAATPHQRRPGDAERAHDPDHARGDQEDAGHDHDRQQALARAAQEDQPGDQRDDAEDRAQRPPAGLADDRVDDLEDRGHQQVDAGEDAEHQQRLPGPHDRQHAGEKADQPEDDEQPPVPADLRNIARPSRAPSK